MIARHGKLNSAQISAGQMSGKEGIKICLKREIIISLFFL